MKRKWSMLGIDACGGAVTAGLLGACVWCAFLAQPEGGESFGDLSGAVDTARQDLNSLRAALQDQKTLKARYEAELAAVGALPSQTPPETYLRTLSDLAAQNRLSVVRQLPLAAREYPGLMEQRFAYEVQGTMPDLARFFKDVEISPGSTDISYLKVERGKEDGSSQRTALLTFSVFSMSKEQPPAQAGG